MSNDWRELHDTKTKGELAKSVVELSAEVERLRQYKEQRDKLLSANIEKSNNLEKVYSLWAEEKKQLQQEVSVLKNDLNACIEDRCVLQQENGRLRKRNEYLEDFHFPPDENPETQNSHE